MQRDDFYPFMKVSLNGEYGVVTDQFLEVNRNGIVTIVRPHSLGILTKKRT
jgi:hypothetical protein